VTVYNAAASAGARAGEVVAIHGIAGSAISACSTRRQMGFETVAINCGTDKEPLARQLERKYIDSERARCVTELQKAGWRACDSGDRAITPRRFPALVDRLVGQRHTIGTEPRRRSR